MPFGDAGEMGRHSYCALDQCSQPAVHFRSSDSNALSRFLLRRAQSDSDHMLTVPQEVREWLRDPKNRTRYLDDLVWLIHDRFGIVCSTTTMSKLKRKWLRVIEYEETGTPIDDLTRSQLVSDAIRSSAVTLEASSSGARLLSFFETRGLKSSQMETHPDLPLLHEPQAPAAQMSSEDQSPVPETQLAAKVAAQTKARAKAQMKARTERKVLLQIAPPAFVAQAWAP